MDHELLLRCGRIQRIGFQIEWADAQVASIAVHIVFIACEFKKFFARRHQCENPRKRPWLCVELWIFHRHFVRQMIRIRPRSPLDHVHRVAMRVRVIVDPAQLVLEPNRVDYQRVPLPMADSISKKGRLKIFLVGPAIGGDGPKGPHQLVKKCDAIRVLDNFKRDSADAGPRDPGKKTQGLRIDRFRQIVFVRLFSGRREWRASDALKHATENQRALPEAGKIGFAVRCARRRFWRSGRSSNRSRRARQLAVRVFRRRLHGYELAG